MTKKQMNIFITGKPGCGKSSLIRELIEGFKDKNKKIAGIITPEIRRGKGEGREGFEIVNLASGKREILASTTTRGPKVSRYGVNVRGIDKIVEEFEKSFDDAEYIFIDEVGKMEMFSERFKEMLDKVLNSDKIVIATLHRNLVSKFRGKGKVFELTRENREEIKKKVLEIST